MSLKKKRKEYNHKEFAVGTKIEYNNKLYEVVKNDTCENCSIRLFCSASDNYVSSLLIPRDKLLNTFGKCSAIDRADGISVVFKEVPMTKSNNNTINSIIIQALVEADGTVKDLQIKAPTNFKIDVEASDLAKGIIRFKNKWLSLEQLYKLAKENNYHTYLSEIKDSKDDKSCTVREKLIGLANLMDIAKYFNGGWEYDVTEEVVGYSIAYYKFVEKPHYSVCKLDTSVYTYYGSPVFKNEADAQYVIDNPNFREVLDNIFKV